MRSTDFGTMRYTYAYEHLTTTDGSSYNSSADKKGESPKPRHSLGREYGSWSTRNSSKGALLRETLECLRFLAQGHNLDDLRESVLSKDLLHKRARESRVRCWRSLTWRYLWPPNNPVARALASMAGNPRLRLLLRGAIYYHFCLADRAAYDVATDLLWGLKNSGRREIRGSDIERYFLESRDRHPEVNQWAPSTRRKPAVSISFALRDFGRLEGKARKRLVPPPLPTELLLYVTRFHKDEGCSSREILFSHDFRIWGSSPEDVAAALRQEASRGFLRFEWSGNTVVLDIGGERFNAYAQRLGREIS